MPPGFDDAVLMRLCAASASLLASRRTDPIKILANKYKTRIREIKWAMARQNPPPLVTNSRLHIGFMPDSEILNRQIIEGYLQLREQDFLRRSHFFGGRYENLYFERERIPAIARVLEQAESYAQNLLQQTNSLRSGFWINDMGPGESTTEHDHDEDDEMLSAVYYVQVPQDSGDLVIVDRYSRTLLTPQAGMFVFFAPSVVHSVSVNRSAERRISMGMNFGPVSKE